MTSLSPEERPNAKDLIKDSRVHCKRKLDLELDFLSMIAYQKKNEIKKLEEELRDINDKQRALMKNSFINI